MSKETSRYLAAIDNYRMQLSKVLVLMDNMPDEIGGVVTDLIQAADEMIAAEGRDSVALRQDYRELSEAFHELLETTRKHGLSVVTPRMLELLRKRDAKTKEPSGALHLSASRWN